MRNGDRLVIIEAKGGASGALNMTNHGEQLSQNWILEKIRVLRTKGDTDWADQLEDARRSGNLDVMKVHTPVVEIQLAAA